MMNDAELASRIERLEEEVRSLKYRNESLRDEERDRFVRYFVGAGLRLIYVVMGLIALALVLRFGVEYLRLPRAPDAGTGRPATQAPEQRGTTPTSEQPTDPKRKLDDYVDRAADKRGGGNSYSVRFDGLGELINGMVKTGQIAADKGTALMQELGKSVISTTGDILKESAKAIIARYLGPESDKASKATGGAPTQQVLVNVYGGEKRVVASQPKQPARPAKPKPACPVPAPVPDSKPASCSPS